MGTRLWLWLAVGTILQIGCAGTATQTDSFRVTGGGPFEEMQGFGSAQVGTRMPQDPTIEATSAVASAVTTSSGTATGITNAKAVTPEPKVILFDFDSTNINSDTAMVLKTHGAYLAAHPEVNVSLEGHGDELGTREFNLALGERRAFAVKQFLVAEGANAEQLRVFSYGEERPAHSGQDEDALMLNRRVELVY